MLCLHRLLIFSLCAVVGSSQAADPTESTSNLNRQAREIRMAEGAILVTISASRNSLRTEFCSDHSRGCVGDALAELGISLIASRNHDQSVSALVSLVRFKFDGGLSTDWTCLVLHKGSIARPHLKRLKAMTLAERCKSEVSRLVLAYKGKFDEHLARDVCSTEEEIAKKVREVLHTISAGRRCSPTDY